MEADERHILNRDLHEFHAQLVGFVAGRGNLRQLVDDLGRFRIVPAGALAGAALAERNDQIRIPAVDLGIQVSGNAAGRPVARDVVAADRRVGVPGRGGFARQIALQAELGQLVVGSDHAAARLRFGVGKIRHVDHEGLAVVVPAVVLLLKTSLDQQLRRRFRIILPAADTEHVDQLVFGAFNAQLLRHARSIAGVEGLHGRAVAEVEHEFILEPGQQRLVVQLLHRAGGGQDREAARAANAVEHVHGDLVEIHRKGDAPAEINVVVGRFAHHERQALRAGIVARRVRELVVPARDLVVVRGHYVQNLGRDFAEDVRFVVDHAHLAGRVVAQIAEPDVLRLRHLAGHDADGGVLPVFAALVENTVAQLVIRLYGVRAGDDRFAVLEGGHILNLGVDVLGNDAAVVAPDRYAELQRQAREALLGDELHGVIVHLFNGREHGVVVVALGDALVGHDHVEREYHVVRVEVFAVRPLDALANLHDVLGEVLVGLGHAFGDFAELLALHGIHFPHHRAHQLMDAEAHLSALHVGVELAGNVGRGLGFHDQGFGTRSTDGGRLFGKRNAGERCDHQNRQQEGQKLTH